MLRTAALAFVFLISVAIGTAAADSLTLTWDSNPLSEGVIGYLVYVGTTPGVYPEVFDVGNQTTFFYQDAVAGQRYFIAVAAYNAQGISPYAKLSVETPIPPSLDNPGYQWNAPGDTVSLQLVGADAFGAPVNYAADGLPPGLTLDGSSGLISGVTTTVGVYDVTATATDSRSTTTPQTFTWFVDGGPPTVAITSPTTDATYSTQDSTVTLAGTASDDLAIVAVAWENERAGVGGVGNGLANWSTDPLALKAGENHITVTVRDAAGYSSTAAITVTSPGTPAPTVAITLPTSDPTYSTSSTTIDLGGTASDSVGVTNITWVSDRGDAGNVFFNVGQLFTTWSRPALVLLPGANVITVTAWNDSENSSSAVLTVNRANHPPTLANPGNRTNAENDSVSLQLVGNDADGDPITYAATGLPSGLTLDPWSGLISGTLPYTAAAVYSTTLSVSDGASTTYAYLTWTVTNTNRAPVLTNPGPQSSLQGVVVTLPISVVDADGDPLALSAVNLPPGLTLNSSARTISGTPTTLGVFAVVISVSDGTALVQTSVSWSVASPLPAKASPVSPSGSIGTTTPAFSWIGDIAAAYYALSVTDSSAGSPTVVWFNPSAAGCPLGGTCTVAAPKSLASGLVTWAVITWNPFGYGPWSLTTSAVVDVADPSVPTPATGGPSGPISTRTPTYAWTAIGSATWYELSVTDALGSTQEFWYTPTQACVSSACAVTPNTLLPIGPAQWKVRAWRTTGAGAWSGLVSFEAADSAPGTATLVSPLSPVATVTPTFTWNAVVGTSYYLLRVVDRDSVTTDRWYRPTDAGCPTGTGICTASPGIALKAGEASWMVLTWNGSGYGPWSATREFLVEIADPAALTPSAVSPTGAIVSTNVTYHWTAMAGALSYRLSIRNNGGAPTYFWYSPAAAGCSAGTDCSAVPALALLNGTAEWEVQVWTTIGYGPWSPPVALTVSIPAPPAPTAVSPSGPAGSASPLFKWNASINATLYYVRASDPTGLRVDKWLTPSQVGCASGGLCTLNAGVTLTTGAGSWQVIAWNPTGYSPWSSTLAFVVP